MQNHSQKFDVIILGSGIAGSTLATILAKYQAKVLMIDKVIHPRFTIGEALTSHTERLLALLSYQYGIPEFNHLSSFDKINDNIPDSNCGFKRSFGFLYHQEGQPQSPSERIQWGVTRSTHLFRQEIDHYLVQVATKYGSQLLSEKNVTDIDISHEGVTVKLENGEEFQGKYIVDASGYRSILATKFGLREQPTRFQTKSRSLFNHMVDVKNIDDCLSTDENKLMPWYKGTVHHVFDGGWMWIIPFNNHARSSNPICSVGLNLDINRFPKNNAITPEIEFRNFLSKFPTIANQFENAHTVRKWVSTDRLQYSSHSCTGERFFILPHAAGFVDPIFSPGLIQTFITISPLAALIIQALTDNDYSRRRFASLEHLQQRIFDYNDRIANCTYIAFQNFELMNVWLRVWIMQHMMSVGKLSWNPLLDLVLEDRQEYTPKDWSRFTGIDYLKDIDPVIEGWGNNYVRRAITKLEEMEKDLLSPEETVSEIISLLDSTSWLFKACGVTNPSKHFIDLLKSSRFNLSFLAYSFWSQFFLKKETRPFNVNIKGYINAVRWGVEV